MKESEFVKWLKSQIAKYENSLNPYNQGLHSAYKETLIKYQGEKQ